MTGVDSGRRPDPEPAEDPGLALRTWSVHTASALPILVAIGVPLLQRGIEQPVAFTVIAVTGMALFLLGLGQSLQAARRGLAPGLWHPGYALATIALSVPYFVLVVDLAPSLVVLLYALTLVAGAYANPPSWRLGFGATVLACWQLTLLLDAQVGAAVHWLHAVAGALVLATSVQTVSGLQAAIGIEAEQRLAAQRRAALLSELLTATGLDSQAVLGAVQSAVRDLGFDVVVVRRLLPERGELELIVGSAPDGAEPEPVVPLDTGVYRGISATGPDLHTTQVLDNGAFAVVVPIFEQRHLRGVVAAVDLAGQVREVVDGTVVPLMRGLGRAVFRAEAYAADRRTIDELVELDRQANDLVATLSHELRTPLTVVQGLSQTLDSRWQELSAEQRCELVERIDLNALRLEGMVGALLDAAILERGELALELQEVDLSELVAGVTERFAPMLAGWQLELAVEPGLVVRGDPPALASAMEQLLANVVKHTPEGTRVRIAVRAGDRDRVLVEVHDDGPGIAPEDLPHVAERFYRGGDHLHRSSSGLGLGLALARRVVSAHGAHLEVTNDAGVTVSFDLPRVPPSDPGR